MNRALRTALTVAVVYMVIGGLWIYYSDAAIQVLVDDVATMRQLQTWKGLGFILMTGLLVFWLSWRALYRQQELIERLEQYAYVHPLTGLPSRLAASEMIDRAIERADPHRDLIAVVHGKLDNFGAINDSFGHEIGDQLLRAVGERVCDQLGKDGGVAHIGADEFVFFSTDINSKSDLKQGGRLRQPLAKPFDVDGIKGIHLSACLGVSFYPDDGSNSAELLRCSDAALDRAKERGAGSVEMFDRAMLEQARRQVELDSRLRTALEDDELSLHFQPIYQRESLITMSGMEALLRWQPAGEAPISPGEFIPVAEKSDLILKIGAWVIERACAQIGQWLQAGVELVPISINLSIRQLGLPDLAGQITAALDRHRIPRNLLVLEVTESLLMQEGDGVLETLAALQAEGLSIALDDFGTGYSSLAYLMDLPIDWLKIDRSFVKNLERGQSGRDLVAAMIGLANSFGLKVIAEGVENRAQQDILEALGCHRFQGYLFSKPVPADEARVLLEQDSARVDRG